MKNGHINRCSLSTTASRAPVNTAVHLPSPSDVEASQPPVFAGRPLLELVPRSRLYLGREPRFAHWALDLLPAEPALELLTFAPALFCDAAALIDFQARCMEKGLVTLERLATASAETPMGHGTGTRFHFGAQGLSPVATSGEPEIAADSLRKSSLMSTSEPDATNRAGCALFRLRR